LTKPRALKESDVQKLIVDALRLAGLTVLHTSAYRQKGPSGVSKGVPDLLVAHPLLQGCFIGIEVKKPGAIKWSSEEQRLLYETGCTLVAQSPGDALRHVYGFCEGESALANQFRCKIGGVLRGVDPTGIYTEGGTDYGAQSF
jgi:hypothetical protein